MISTLPAKLGRFGAIVTAGMSLAVAAVAPHTALAQGQAQTVATNSVSYDDAMGCGVTNAFLAGLMEADDPDFAANLVDTATIWLEMALKRHTGTGAEYDARVDGVSAALTDKVSTFSDEEALANYLVNEIERCETIRDANAAEFGRVAEEMLGEG